MVARLQRWQGQQPDPAGSEYDDEPLQSLVREFQNQSGLKVDGVAGVQTQMLLDGALAQPGTPRLVMPPGGG